MDSVAAIFARAGNPWVSERDQTEWSEPQIPAAELVRIKRRLKKGDTENRPLRGQVSHQESARAAELRHQLSVRQSLIAALGGSRTVACSTNRPDPLVAWVSHPSGRELGTG